MKMIKVSVRQKEKEKNALTMLNLRDEIVNVIYKDTVANSARSSLYFYVLLYLAQFQSDGKDALTTYLDKVIPKFRDLNNHLISRKEYLQAGQYRQLVVQYGLEGYFNNDGFFTVVSAVMNMDDVMSRFGQYFTDHPKIKQTFEEVSKTYVPIIEEELNVFSKKHISDYRYDDFGNQLDLSKSVYRTVVMRQSRKVDLKLQRYTEVNSIVSRSPIIVDFVQYVDPQIVLDIWNAVDVDSILKTAAPYAKDFAWESAKAGAIAVLANAYSKHKRTNGRSQSKEKRIARNELNEFKKFFRTELEDTVSPLVESVLNADKKLESVIELHKKEKDSLLKMRIDSRDEKIKGLETRIKRLENLEIKSEVLKSK